MTDRPKPWTAKEYCEWRGISEGSAAQERYKGDGPRFIKAGKRVFYDPADVFDWIDSRKTARTDAPVGAA